MNTIIIISIIIAIILLITTLYFRPTSLWAGGSFSFLIGIAAFLFHNHLKTIHINLSLLISIPFFFIFIFFLLFGAYSINLALFFDEATLKGEKAPAFKNILPIVLTTILIIIGISLFLTGFQLQHIFVKHFWLFISMFFIYATSVAFFFSVTALLYNILPIWGKVDYIIILGVGLNKNQVTPILASRIEKGLKLYYQQVEKHHHTPVIILSGGQGHDELIAEADAMKSYILKQDLTIPTIYLEKQSTNTNENILFSKKLLIKKENINNFTNKRIVLATSNYHLLRAGKLAASLGISAQGTGAKTNLYFFTIAFIREYIAYLILVKKRHFIVFFICLFVTLISLLSYYI